MNYGKSDPYDALEGSRIDIWSYLFPSEKVTTQRAAQAKKRAELRQSTGLPPAPSAPSSYHAGYTLPSAPPPPSGGTSDPRLAAWLDEQEAAKERRAKRRKRQRRKRKREAEKIQNQPWFYPTVFGTTTLLIILLGSAFRGSRGS